MHEIVDSLQTFSDKKDLWTLTKKKALEALDNYLDKNRTETMFSFSGLTTKNFVFADQSQSLVFWQFNGPSFVVRTTISLGRDNNPNQFTIGEYSLDVDSNGDIADESLIFF
jgi:hypothetical protein